MMENESDISISIGKLLHKGLRETELRAAAVAVVGATKNWIKHSDTQFVVMAKENPEKALGCCPLIGTDLRLEIMVITATVVVVRSRNPIVCFGLN